MPHDTELEAQVRWLVDVEQIKQLKARYAIACDNDYDPDTLAMLFTEDAIWDGGFMGYAETREGIRSFFAEASGLVSFAVHGVTNPLIEIYGDTASGQWYQDQPMVMAGTDLAYWFCARYEDQYERTQDGWKFKHVKVITRAFTPYDDGFGKNLLAELPL